ncbi:MAG: hypothetical protein PHO23_03470 [Candidatus Pacebacteria bacterium]|nr:hypothetical protein [Candidatus Paceibacterota bacterium]
MLSGDFQNYRGIIQPRRVYTATSLYSFNNCQEDLKGEILYNLGFSSDKLSTNDLYQSKYIKSGISLPSSSKFLCVVGNSNILPDYKEDSELKPQDPKLRPC